MKNNKTAKIEVRLTAQEKEKIVSYCEEHLMTVSEFARTAIYQLMNKEVK